VVYGWRKNEKNLEQRINNEFCVKTGKSARETLALLTMAYGEYAIKKVNAYLSSLMMKVPDHVYVLG
jgi:hypothetical protein